MRGLHARDRQARCGGGFTGNMGANEVLWLNRNYCVCADQCEFTINQDIRGKEELQLFVRREVCAELR